MMKSWFDDMSTEEFQLWSDTVELFGFLTLWISLGAAVLILISYNLTLFAVPLAYGAGYLCKHMAVVVKEHSARMHAFYKTPEITDND